MSKLPSKEVPFSKSRRQMLLLPLAVLGSQIISAEVVAAPDSITTRKVEEGCPLNSGGASLLDTQWRVDTVYGNKIPRAVNMIMKVNKNSLSGETGCNSYAASFQQVGNTGFRVSRVNKSKKGCRVIRPVKGGPTYNIGDLEGGYLRTLRRMGSVQQVGNKLVFYNRSGSRGIVMTPM
ncbi:MAG: META domain-containing protein [Thiotrichaceae bacterium]